MGLPFLINQLAGEHEFALIGISDRKTIQNLLLECCPYPR